MAVEALGSVNGGAFFKETITVAAFPGKDNPIAVVAKWEPTDSRAVVGADLTIDEAKKLVKLLKAAIKAAEKGVA